jgi:hypothetical protein
MIYYFLAMNYKLQPFLFYTLRYILGIKDNQSKTFRIARHVYKPLHDMKNIYVYNYVIKGYLFQNYLIKGSQEKII